MSELYSGDILGLAQSLRDGTLAAPDASVRRVAKLCGSEIDVDLAVEGGVVTAYAQRVRACALGQASAALLAEHVVGASCEAIVAARDTLHAMLKLDGDPPEGRFANLAKLAGVKSYPARHQSVMLPWEAVVEAAVEACGKAEL